jgi:hypothetical protein
MSLGERAASFWQDLVAKRVGSHPMLTANLDMIRRVVRGQGPDEADSDPMLGARVAINIAAVHVPSFCNPPAGTKAYKNTYDLEKTPLIGDLPAGTKPPARTVVDTVLSQITETPAPDIYFGAVELNGTGIRFYGDVCMILNADAVGADPVVLSSNSYDLIRPPITPPGQEAEVSTLLPQATKMAGRWQQDKQDMVALKTLDQRAGTDRRLTTGQISDAVLNDEDYLEVLKIDSFDSSHLQEVRLSAADVAAETQIGERLRLGQCPPLTELQWRKHRRAALAALRKRGVSSRVVTTAGRVRR